jgi:hypothetical protein
VLAELSFCWAPPAGLVRGLAAAMPCIDFDARWKWLARRSALRERFLVRAAIELASARPFVLADDSAELS